jgi:flagellar motor switch protein FliM
MNPGEETHDPVQAAPSPDLEHLLASVTKAEEENAAIQTAKQVVEPEKSSVQPFDFRNRMLLAPAELRKLKMHQEEFANALAARLSLYLRLEFSLKLTGLQTIAYGKLAQSWSDPSHLTLFKIEPLRGVSILEIPPRLGLSIVDRLMGGPGQASDATWEMSEIENALLDQAVQLILGEWCTHWSKVKELKPVLLGCETNGKFIQSALPETMMLVILMEARIGECTERLQIGFPYSSVEALIRQLTKGADSGADSPPQPAPKAPCKWNPCFDDIPVPLVAEWLGIEMTAREVLALKVGDVLKIDGKNAQQVKVRLADHHKFNGRLGTVAGNWAIELTQVINR